jgi:hypothetical protein
MQNTSKQKLNGLHDDGLLTDAKHLAVHKGLKTKSNNYNKKQIRIKLTN